MGSALVLLLRLLLVCNMICGVVVEGFQFAFNGFRSSEALYIVPNSQLASDSGLQYDSTGGYFYLVGIDKSAGRLLLPGQVQVRDPANLAVKSFSTTFVYQILVSDVSVENGAGIAFIMVPDNFTLGDPFDYMGLMSENSSAINANTFGVELDTYQNPEFNDTNDNHFGLDLGSMNSTQILVPIGGFSIATLNEAIYNQMWIDYVAEDSRMDIFYGQYGKGKPDTPQGVWTSVDLSLLKENMYIGFATAIGARARNDHRILAWSFSNEGYAPAIYIAGQAPPDAPTTPPPPPGASKPPPPRSNTPSPPGNDSSPLGPGVIGSGSSPKGKLSGGEIAGIVIGTVGGLLFVCMIFLIKRGLGLPLRLFLAHATGEDGAGKNFAQSLRDECLKKTWKYWFGLIKVFLDRPSLPKGKPFPPEIQRNLDKTHVGVVIITETFFEKKWCMTELMSFVRSRKMNPDKVRILPLFYKMKINEVREKLSAGHWDENWRQVSTENHPIDVEECKQAVSELFVANGIEYPFNGQDRDVEYREIVLKEIEKIWTQMVKERYSEMAGKLRNRILRRS